MLRWDAPFQRIAYWNKFGHPEGFLTRIGDYRDMPDVCGGSTRRRTPQLRRGDGAITSMKLPVGQTEIALLAGVRRARAGRGRRRNDRRISSGGFC